MKTDTANCEEQIASVNNSLHELVSTYENSKAEIQLAKIKIENFTEAIAKTKTDIEQSDELIGRLMNERADAQAALVGEENELAVLEPAFMEKQNAADLLEEKYVNIDSFISKITDGINAQDALLTQKQHALNEIASKTASHVYIIEKLDEQKEEISAHLETMKAESGGAYSESDAYKQAKAALAELLKEKTAAADKADLLKEKISRAFTKMQTDDARLKLLIGYENTRQAIITPCARFLPPKINLAAAYTARSANSSQRTPSILRQSQRRSAARSNRLSLRTKKRLPNAYACSKRINGGG
jgi:chromosome segregation ATPase